MAEDTQDPTDTAPLPEIDRQTIREVIQAQHEFEMERLEGVRRAVQHKKREERVENFQKRQEKRAREAHARRVKSLQEANERVGAHVSTASRSLRAALGALTSVSAPRHTAEGREQQRIIRSLQAAIGSLRRVGSGEFYESDIDLGSELDAV